MLNFPNPVSSRRPSMLETYLTAKQQRMQEEESAFQRQRQTKMDERAANQDERAEETHNRRIQQEDAAAKAASENAQRERNRKAAERDLEIMQNDDLRIADEHALKGATDAQGTQAWLAHIKRTNPDRYEQDFSNGQWDKNGDGILDAEIREQGLGMIGSINSMPPKQIAELAEAMRIANDPEAPEHEREAARALVGKTSGGSRDSKIESLVAQSIPRDRAANMVDGHERIEMTDTGNMRYINEVDQTVTEIPVAADEPVIAEPKKGKTLWDHAEAGTGIASAVQAGLAVPASMAGLDYDSAVIKARQALRTEQGQLIRALSINPRFPVAEMERIREEVKIAPGMLDTPELMRDRMREIDSALRDRVAQYEKDADNPKLPDDLREARLQAASDINNFLSVLGVPQDGLQPGHVEDGWRFKGGDPSDPGNWEEE